MSVQAQMLDPAYIDPELDKAGRSTFFGILFINVGPRAAVK
jgi:hypothetical protein